jgi:glycosyltransferase involved in cell wall biosynthesis
MNKITIITPCYNEEDNVEICAQEVKKIMNEFLPNYEYEHIFADNASIDNTFEILNQIASSDKNINIVSSSVGMHKFKGLNKIYTSNNN